MEGATPRVGEESDRSSDTLTSSIVPLKTSFYGTPYLRTAQRELVLSTRGCTGTRTTDKGMKTCRETMSGTSLMSSLIGFGTLPLSGSGRCSPWSKRSFPSVTVTGMDRIVRPAR